MQAFAASLVKEVQKYPELYDTGHSKFGKRTAATKAWEEISTVTGIPGAVCRNKWSTLKDTLTTYLRKEDRARKEYYLMKPMLFVVPFLNCPLNAKVSALEKGEDDVGDNENDEKIDDEDDVIRIEEIKQEDTKPSSPRKLKTVKKPASSVDSDDEEWTPSMLSTAKKPKNKQSVLQTTKKYRQMSIKKEESSSLEIDDDYMSAADFLDMQEEWLEDEEENRNPTKTPEKSPKAAKRKKASRSAEKSPKRLGAIEDKLQTLRWSLSQESKSLVKNDEKSSWPTYVEDMLEVYEEWMDDEDDYWKVDISLMLPTTVESGKDIESTSSSENSPRSTNQQSSPTTRIKPWPKRFVKSLRSPTIKYRQRPDPPILKDEPLSLAPYSPTESAKIMRKMKNMKYSMPEPLFKPSIPAIIKRKAALKKPAAPPEQNPVEMMFTPTFPLSSFLRAANTEHVYSDLPVSPAALVDSPKIQRQVEALMQKPTVEQQIQNTTVEPQIQKPTVEQQIQNTTVEPQIQKPTVEQQIQNTTVEPPNIQQVKPQAQKPTVEAVNVLRKEFSLSTSPIRSLYYPKFDLVPNNQAEERPSSTLNNDTPLTQLSAELSSTSASNVDATELRGNSESLPAVQTSPTQRGESLDALPQRQTPLSPGRSPKRLLNPVSAKLASPEHEYPAKIQQRTQELSKQAPLGPNVVECAKSQEEFKIPAQKPPSTSSGKSARNPLKTVPATLDLSDHAYPSKIHQKSRESSPAAENSTSEAEIQQSELQKATVVESEETLKRKQELRRKVAFLSALQIQVTPSKTDSPKVDNLPKKMRSRSAARKQAAQQAPQRHRDVDQVVEAMLRLSDDPAPQDPKDPVHVVYNPKTTKKLASKIPPARRLRNPKYVRRTAPVGEPTNTISSLTPKAAESSKRLSNLLHRLSYEAATLPSPPSELILDVPSKSKTTSEFLDKVSTKLSQMYKSVSSQNESDLEPGEIRISTFSRAKSQPPTDEPKMSAEPENRKRKAMSRPSSPTHPAKRQCSAETTAVSLPTSPLKSLLAASQIQDFAPMKAEMSASAPTEEESTAVSIPNPSASQTFAEPASESTKTTAEPEKQKQASNPSQEPNTSLVDPARTSKTVENTQNVPSKTTTESGKQEQASNTTQEQKSTPKTVGPVEKSESKPASNAQISPAKTTTEAGKQEQLSNPTQEKRPSPKKSLLDTATNPESQPTAKVQNSSTRTTGEPGKQIANPSQELETSPHGHAKLTESKPTENVRNSKTPADQRKPEHVSNTSPKAPGGPSKKPEFKPTENIQNPAQMTSEPEKQASNPTQEQKLTLKPTENVQNSPAEAAASSEKLLQNQVSEPAQEEAPVPKNNFNPAKKLESKPTANVQTSAAMRAAEFEKLQQNQELTPVVEPAKSLQEKASKESPPQPVVPTMKSQQELAAKLASQLQASLSQKTADTAKREQKLASKSPSKAATDPAKVFPPSQITVVAVIKDKELGYRADSRQQPLASLEKSQPETQFPKPTTSTSQSMIGWTKQQTKISTSQTPVQKTPICIYLPTMNRKPWHSRPLLPGETANRKQPPIQPELVKLAVAIEITRRKKDHVSPTQFQTSASTDSAKMRPVLPTPPFRIGELTTIRALRDTARPRGDPTRSRSRVFPRFFTKSIEDPAFEASSELQGESRELSFKLASQPSTKNPQESASDPTQPRELPFQTNMWLLKKQHELASKLASQSKSGKKERLAQQAPITLMRPLEPPTDTAKVVPDKKRPRKRSAKKAVEIAENQFEQTVSQKPTSSAMKAVEIAKKQVEHMPRLYTMSPSVEPSDGRKKLKPKKPKARTSYPMPPPPETVHPAVDMAKRQLASKFRSREVRPRSLRHLRPLRPKPSPEEATTPLLDEEDKGHEDMTLSSLLDTSQPHAAKGQEELSLTQTAKELQESEKIPCKSAAATEIAKKEKEDAFSSTSQQRQMEVTTVARPVGSSAQTAEDSASAKSQEEARSSSSSAAMQHLDVVSTMSPQEPLSPSSADTKKKLKKKQSIIGLSVSLEELDSKSPIVLTPKATAVSLVIGNNQLPLSAMHPSTRPQRLKIQQDLVQPPALVSGVQTPNPPPPTSWAQLSKTQLDAMNKTGPQMPPPSKDSAKGQLGGPLNSVTTTTATKTATTAARTPQESTTKSAQHQPSPFPANAPKSTPSAPPRVQSSKPLPSPANANKSTPTAQATKKSQVHPQKPSATPSQPSKASPVHTDPSPCTADSQSTPQTSPGQPLRDAETSSSDVESVMMKRVSEARMRLNDLRSCEKKEAAKGFLASLLPDMLEMPDDHLRSFKRKVMRLVDETLEAVRQQRPG